MCAKCWFLSTQDGQLQYVAVCVCYSYNCDCENTGFIGDHCEEDIPECASNPCQHGATCLEGINHYSCQCWPGK